MHRFYCADTDLNAKTVLITHPEELHHLRTVLRLKKGDEVRLFNGQKREAKGVIRSLEPEGVQVDILELKIISVPDQPRLVLACAIPKKAKFETIIEKCTELGIDEIIPLKTRRTEVQFDAVRMNKKLKRYATVAVNAAKQCRRATIPLIHPVTPMAEALTLTKNAGTFGIIPCLQGDRWPVREVARRAADYRTIVCFIGPEGDFTPAELEAARTAGCLPVTLGETVLKVDTAAVSIIAVLSVLLTSREGARI